MVPHSGFDLHFSDKEWYWASFHVFVSHLYVRKYAKAVYCPPAYVIYMQNISWETLGWKKHKLESRLPEEISTWYADDTTFMAESEEELKSLLMKLKVESEKVGLKLNIQKMKIMASGPTTSWEIDGETVETVSDFIFLGSKITADGDCSHEIKSFTPWKESYDQPR